MADRVTLRLPNDLLERVDQAAAALGMHRSAWLRMAAERQLEACQSERLAAQLRRDIAEMIAASESILLQRIDEQWAHPAGD